MEERRKHLGGMQLLLAVVEYAKRSVGFKFVLVVLTATTNAVIDSLLLFVSGNIEVTKRRLAESARTFLRAFFLSESDLVKCNI